MCTVVHKLIDLLQLLLFQLYFHLVTAVPECRDRFLVIYLDTKSFTTPVYFVKYWLHSIHDAIENINAKLVACTLFRIWST